MCRSILCKCIYYFVLVIKIEKWNFEQCVAIKCCVELGDSATDTHGKILKVYGSVSMSRAQVFRWHKEFKDGRESVEDEAWNERAVAVLICFFDSHGVVHKEFVSAGQTVNRVCYRNVLERLRKRVNRVRPNIARTWIFHHDNAPCHSAFSVTHFSIS